MEGTGTVQTRGEFHLTTAPLAIRAEGIADLVDATYAGRDIGQAKLNWQFEQDAFRLTSQSADIFGGRYLATASMRELDWSLAEIEAKFDGIEVAKLAAMLPGDLSSPRNLPVTGRIDGGLKITSLADLSKLTGNFWFKTDSVSVHRLPMDMQRCVIALNAGRVKAICNGVAAEGTFDGSASTTITEVMKFTSQPKIEFSYLPVVAEFKLKNVSAEKLVLAAGLDRRDVPVQALANFTIVRDDSMGEAGVLCNAVASVEDVRWKQSRLAPIITANLTVEPERIVLRNLSGQFADGRVSGRGEVRLDSGLDGSFELAASRVNLRRAAEPFGGAAMRVSGSGDVSVRGRLGRTITGNLRLGADHLSAAGISIPRVRVPVDWSYTIDSQSARWRCRGGVIEAGNGEVRITTDGSFNRQLNMNFLADIARVDTSRLMVGKSAGAGIIDGRVTIHAKRATSMRNVNGAFDLELSHVKAMEIPVFSDLTQLIKLPQVPGLNSGPASDGGTIHGRLSGPVIYIDQIALQQSNVQVLVDGRSTIDGRLDLNVMASTGSTSPTEGLISMLDSPLMLAAPAPVALLAKANEAMKDRVVNVHVGGTAARPVMKIQPAKTLTQDAIRFFLSSTVGSQVANATTNSNSRKQR